jgi:hypothetical protein
MEVLCRIKQTRRRVGKTARRQFETLAVASAGSLGRPHPRFAFTVPSGRQTPIHRCYINNPDSVQTQTLHALSFVEDSLIITHR